MRINLHIEFQNATLEELVEIAFTFFDVIAIILGSSKKR